MTTDEACDRLHAARNWMEYSILWLAAGAIVNLAVTFVVFKLIQKVRDYRFMYENILESARLLVMVAATAGLNSSTLEIFDRIALEHPKFHEILLTSFKNDEGASLLLDQNVTQLIAKQVDSKEQSEKHQHTPNAEEN